MRTGRGIGVCVCVLAATGCGEGVGRLPPVPLVEGPLRLRVVSPASGDTLPEFRTYSVYGSVGTGRATLSIDGVSVPVLPNGSFLGRVRVPGRGAAGFAVVAALGADTARVVVPVYVSPRAARRAGPEEAPPAPGAGGGDPAYALLVAPGADPGDPAPVVVGRPTPNGPFRWFLLPGTRVRVTGTAGEFTRVYLDSGQEAWVKSRDVRPAAPGGERVNRASTPRVSASREWVDVVVPVGERPPFLVEEKEDGFVLTLYGTGVGPAAATAVAGGDPLVREVRPERVAEDRTRYRITTARMPFGYAVLWEEGALVLRIRRPPRIDRGAPLRGLTIAVDPGHPPLGAVGPTGLEEATVTLAVGLRLKRLLEDRGARVVMTRTDLSPVELEERPRIARRASAHALVSIHVDARHGEDDPYAASGTRTLFFHPHSWSLAGAVQGGMVKRMGLDDRGVIRSEMALVRPTWMPAVLCEGAMLIIPEQEAALRTPAYQAAYARGIAEGLEGFFRSIE